MTIKVVVFDFDGTLIDSNKLKYDAYFTLFPEDDKYVQLIGEVLSESYEKSRYVILEEILRRSGEPAEESTARVQVLANKYNEVALAGAKICSEKNGAEDVLRELKAQFPLYVSSTTPENALREIIFARKWQGYFTDIFGYPRKKSQTLKKIMFKEQVVNSELMVVGDGESDRLAATKCACRFIKVTEDYNLRGIPKLLQAL